jgi:hypothetical protein
MRRLTVVLVLVGCGADPVAPDEPEGSTDVATPAVSAPAAPSDPLPGDAQRFEATVDVAEVDENARGHKFRGTMLQRDGEPRPVVVTYANSAVWSALDGARVRVVGVPYHPEGRAIVGDHLEVLEAHLVDPKAGKSVLGFGRKHTLRGRLAQVVPPKGEGSSYFTFKPVSGPTFEVYDLSGELVAEPPLDVELEVEAHEVELSPALWIRSVKR